MDQGSIKGGDLAISFMQHLLYLGWYLSQI